MGKNFSIPLFYNHHPDTPCGVPRAFPKRSMTTFTVNSVQSIISPLHVHRRQKVDVYACTFFSEASRAEHERRVLASRRRRYTCY
jgi:DUF917 family protein